MTYPNDASLPDRGSEAASSDPVQLNIGYLIFALGAVVLAFSSMSLARTAWLPDCQYTVLGDVTGYCH